MKTPLTTTAAALAALAWLPPSTSAAAAQETTTIEAALEELQQQGSGLYSPIDPASRILRQVSVDWLHRATPDPRAAAELDALADQLAAMVLDSTLPEHVRSNAEVALIAAASPESGRGHEGTPYPRAFDLLVELYEGGYDDALSAIWRADSVRGHAYVRELFERSERPPLCRRYLLEFVSVPGGVPECPGYIFRLDARPTPWCRAGKILFLDIADEAHRAYSARRMRIALEGGGLINGFPEGMPEHVEDWYLRCY